MDRIGLAEALAARVGADAVQTDPSALEPYGRDESGLPGRAPDVLVRARSVEDVQAVLRLASERRVPVTPCGARTGKSGGSIPAHGGIALSLERLDRICEVSREDLTLTAEAGVILARVQEAAEAAGLSYPPDPNSWETCTLGGNVAENAGGPSALKYGVTRDYVLGLEAVLPSGERIRTGRRTSKGVAGYDLTSLLVGSEGTLAVVTEVTVRLVPRSRVRRAALVLFPDAARASAAVSAILLDGILPRALEFFDEVALDAVRAAGAPLFAAGAGAALLVECDGDEDDAVLGALARIAELAAGHGAAPPEVAQTESQRRALWALRAQVSGALRRVRGRKLSEDVVVPRSRLPEAVAALKELGRRHGLVVATYGHAGDGNLHANVLFAPDDPPAVVEACVADVVRTALALGGTITGEHGVGLAKRGFLAWEQDATTLELQRRLKAVFDPLGILNPGKLLP